ncbi:hypothetical protein LEP1GSC061_2173 [Leptospira wolffii serovar Khorat str. Khorat-H2]|nr:hypothetical protein LEP1GSC061_2173 [Leptospira wolffii serovar Khorat str. Khorat-H2]
MRQIGQEDGARRGSFSGFFLQDKSTNEIHGIIRYSVRMPLSGLLE